MTKQLRKEIMVRSKLRNEFNKSRTLENWKKSKSKCLSTLKVTRTNYLNNLNPKVSTDNKKVWSAVKPLFKSKE